VLSGRESATRYQTPFCSLQKGSQYPTEIFQTVKSYFSEKQPMVCTGPGFFATSLQELIFELKVTRNLKNGRIFSSSSPKSGLFKHNNFSSHQTGARVLLKVLSSEN
jgi:hypothetical protein